MDNIEEDIHHSEEEGSTCEDDFLHLLNDHNNPTIIFLTIIHGLTNYHHNIIEPQVQVNLHFLTMWFDKFVNVPTILMPIAEIVMT